MTQTISQIVQNPNLQVSLVRMGLPEILFDKIERAALPRVDYHTTDRTLAMYGVPQELRSTLGRNLNAVAFPYPRWIKSQGKLGWREYELVQVDSPRWRMLVSPQLGGRVLSLFDKSIQAELFWNPAAMRNAVVGQTGAWMVGGLEFNTTRLSHQIYGQTTLGIERVKTAGGFEGLLMSTTDELFEIRWQIMLALLPDRLAIRIRLENHSNQPQPGWWWTNIAAPMTNQTRVLYPPGPMMHHGAYRLGFAQVTWPQLEGKDWSWWTNHTHCLSSYMYQVNDEYMGFCDNDRQVAMIHTADRRVCPGRKLWTVSSQHENEIWMGRMGEPAMASYCELQSGRSRTQHESDLLAPGQVVDWTESISGMRWQALEPSYQKVYQDYARRAAEALKPNAGVVDDPAQWEIVERETLVKPDARLALSEQITLRPQTIKPAQIDRAVKTGWVGGLKWVDVLRKHLAAGRGNRQAQLALAAAELDLAQIDTALKSLAELAKGDDEAAGYAGFILGAYAEAREDFAAVIRHLTPALPLLKNRDDAYYMLCKAYLKLSRAEEAQRMWDQAPKAVRASDNGRVGQAHTAFLLQRWDEAAEFLSQPLWTVAEGGIYVWEIFKEIHLAKAFELQAQGRTKDALILLTHIAEEKTQFGLGRNEQNFSTELLYYRWRLAKAGGEPVLADTLAQHMMRLKPWPGTPCADALYVWRVARAVGDHSAAERMQAMETFDARAETDLTKILPLRQTLLAAIKSNNPQPLQPLSDHFIWRFRIAYEMANWER